MYRLYTAAFRPFLQLKPYILQTSLPSSSFFSTGAEQKGKSIYKALYGHLFTLNKHSYIQSSSSQLAATTRLSTTVTYFTMKCNWFHPPKLSVSHDPVVVKCHLFKQRQFRCEATLYTRIQQLDQMLITFLYGTRRFQLIALATIRRISYHDNFAAITGFFVSIQKGLRLQLFVRIVKRSSL